MNIEKLAKKVLTQASYAYLKSCKISWNVNSLLKSNTKMDKGDALILGFAMLPHSYLDEYTQEKNISVCPLAKMNNCIKGCLGTDSGHYSMKKGNAHFKLLKHSILYHYAPDVLKSLLIAELTSLNAKLSMEEKTADIRLNVFSDINWVKFLGEDVFKLSNLFFYDYTKVITEKRIEDALKLNYTLAYSITPAVTGSEFLQKKLDTALMNLDFTALVVPEKIKSSIIEQINDFYKSKGVKSFKAIDGDIVDNFNQLKNGFVHQHIILKGKASTNKVKENLPVEFQSFDQIKTALNWSK